jgi:hypothetical protein
VSGLPEIILEGVALPEVENNDGGIDKNQLSLKEQLK